MSDLIAKTAIDRRLADIVGPVITCLMAQPPIAFAETRRPVVTKGRAVIAAYLPPAGNER